MGPLFPSICSLHFQLSSISCHLLTFRRKRPKFGWEWNLNSISIHSKAVHPAGRQARRLDPPAPPALPAASGGAANGAGAGGAWQGLREGGERGGHGMGGGVISWKNLGKIYEKVVILREIHQDHRIFSRRVRIEWEFHQEKWWFQRISNRKSKQFIG